MEIEDNHWTCKRSRVGGNGKLGQRESHEDDDEDDGEAKGEVNNAIVANNSTLMRPWHHPSSRIFRVSRATGGKDRHSKVYTSKGLRDRRVRLSVSTAIQFYDLQDRLGYDQPSKAIEWLIKAASSAIAELPSLDTTFPEPLNMEKPMPSESGMDPEAEPSYNQQQHSSTSETSKGSVLSLSRCENRIKARERARGRVKDKEKDDSHVASHHQSLDVSLNSQGSFTKLLTGGSGISGQATDDAHFIQKQVQNLLPVTSTADYFGTQSGLFGNRHHHQQQQKATNSSLPAFSPQAHFGNSSLIGMSTFGGSENSAAVETQPFSFLQDHFFPAAAAGATANGGDYNLNFSISTGLAGFHRGTLQSNSPSHHHHHQSSHHHQVQAQRLSASIEGSTVPFFFSMPASTAASVSSTENPYLSGFDGHLQLCDGSYKHFELKGKEKS